MAGGGLTGERDRESEKESDLSVQEINLFAHVGDPKVQKTDL